MIGLEANEQDFYYALFQGTTMGVSKVGYRDGEKTEVYGNPVLMSASISAATGASNMEMFGNLEGYSKVIITHDMDCPIVETTALWVDALPEVDAEGKATKPHDYVVKRIAKSLNVIAYAIAKVNKS
jgi:hypothetical protein